MDPTAFNPDQYLAEKKQALGAGAPAQNPSPVPVDPIQMGQFDPDAYLDSKRAAVYDEGQKKFGTLAQQALAGVEGTARGASLGGSDFLEQQLARVNPDLFAKEAIAGRQAANPWTAGLGNALGGAGLIAATGGLAGPAELGLAAKGIGPVAARVLGMAAEGGVFGAGNAVSDMALGDPNLNAQKILSDVGFGAALGGSFGALSKAIPALPALLRKITGTGNEAVVNPGAIDAVVNTPSNKPAATYAELRKQVSDVKNYGGDPDLFSLPQKPVVEQALPEINQVLSVPINDLDMGSLESQEARDIYKTKMQMPGEAGQVLRDATVARKKQLLGGIDRRIDDIAPEYDATTSALDAGKRATDAFTDAIQTNRDQIGPIIGQIKEMPLPEENHLKGVIQYLTDTDSSPRANPKIATMFDTSGDTVETKPYSTAMGIDRSTYNAVDQMVTALKSDPESFDNLFDIRKGLEQNVDVSKLGNAAHEVGNAKAAFMDYIQDQAQKADPDLKVRDVFKQYAANEEDANYIEKQLGAKVGSSNWRSLATNKPEESILDKVFRDSKTVQASKRILGNDQFNNLLKDYMSVLRNDMTQEGVFSSNKFYSALNRNEYGLGEAFASNPAPLNTIKSYLTGLKTFVDHMPANPSGTAPTLMRSLMEAGYNIPKIIGSLKDYGGSKLESFRQTKEINDLLAGQHDKVAQLNSVAGTLSKVQEKITNGAKSLFNSNAVRGAVLGGGSHLSDKSYDNNVKKLQKVSQNPDQFIDDLAHHTAGLYNSAPNISQSLQTSIMQGIQFLQSKIPQPSANFPLSSDWTASIAQKMQFNRYFQAVDDPLSTLKEVKAGTYTPEHAEAMQAVHPQLLQEMKNQVLENLNVDKAKALPYAQKLSLSQFLGQPLDENMTPQAIFSNQASLSGPSQSQQSAPKQPRTTQAGLKALDVSGRSETKTQGLDEEK